jgi:hypothetical protein
MGEAMKWIPLLSHPAWRDIIHSPVTERHDDPDDEDRLAFYATHDCGCVVHVIRAHRDEIQPCEQHGSSPSATDR